MNNNTLWQSLIFTINVYDPLNLTSIHASTKHDMSRGAPAEAVIGQGKSSIKTLSTGMQMAKIISNLVSSLGLKNIKTLGLNGNTLDIYIYIYIFSFCPEQNGGLQMGTPLESAMGWNTKFWPISSCSPNTFHGYVFTSVFFGGGWSIFKSSRNWTCLRVAPKARGYCPKKV